MSKNATKYRSPSEFQSQASITKVHCWDLPQEINFGVLGDRGEQFDVQPNTFQGTWNLYEIVKSPVDAGEPRKSLGYVKRRRQTPSFRWSMRSPSVVVRTDVAATSVAVALPSTVVDCVENDEELLDDWRSSPLEMLAKLQDPSTTREELFDAVLFAEIAEFDESQTVLLLNLLFAFVNEHRLSQDDGTKTAVGAAIRKLAMNLRDEPIEQYASLFLPTETDTLPCEVELELAKAIVWRLTSSPASLNRALSTLEARLAELAMDYLKPRLILQKNYASVALQSAIGVLLLRGTHSQQVVQSINSLGVGWFSDLFQRRLKRLQQQLQQKGDSVSASIATNLESLVSTLQDSVD